MPGYCALLECSLEPLDGGLDDDPGGDFHNMTNTISAARNVTRVSKLLENDSGPLIANVYFAGY